MSVVSSSKLPTPLRALDEERHFALVDVFAPPTVGSPRNRFRSGSQSDPCISSIRTCDHDYYFELLFIGRGAGRPINYSMFDRTPSRFPGCPACEPNLLHC